MHSEGYSTWSECMCVNLSVDYYSRTTDYDAVNEQYLTAWVLQVLKK